MRAYVINIMSSNNLPCYPPDSHQCDNAVYWRTGERNKYCQVTAATSNCVFRLTQFDPHITFPLKGRNPM